MQKQICKFHQVTALSTAVIKVKCIFSERSYNQYSCQQSGLLFKLVCGLHFTKEASYVFSQPSLSPKKEEITSEWQKRFGSKVRTGEVRKRFLVPATPLGTQKLASVPNKVSGEPRSLQK